MKSIKICLKKVRGAAGCSRAHARGNFGEVGSVDPVLTSERHLGALRIAVYGPYDLEMRNYTAKSVRAL